MKKTGREALHRVRRRRGTLRRGTLQRGAHGNTPHRGAYKGTLHRGTLHRRERAGSLEGLPLQLVIVVIVAAIVLGIMTGWMFIMQDSDPVIDKIVVDPDEVRVKLGETPSINITVLDTEGNLVKGVVVVIEGCSLDMVEELETGEEDVLLKGVALPYGRPTGYLSITAQRSGMGMRSVDVVVFQII